MRTLALLLFTGAASAALLPHYDLDSLIWQSRYIVEVEYVGEKRARVVQSFLGEIEPGTMLVCSVYRVGGFERIPLGATSRLFLFLDERKGLVSSGNWLVSDGRVHRPIQWMNPGGYVWIPTDKGPRMIEFRKALPDRIRAAHAMRKRLDGAPVGDAAPGLLTVLQKRCGLNRDLRRYDLVALAICRQLAILRDHGALAAALRLPLGWDARRTVARGFGTPAGREFLLARIGNPEVGCEVRTKLASVLEDVGPAYTTELVRKGDGWHRVGEPDARNSGYLARIAKLADAARDRESLCATLCEQLRRLFFSARDELWADVGKVVPILVKLHGRSRSERVRYEIARALAQAGNWAYARLRSPAGSVVGIVRRVTEGYEQKKGHLHCRYEYQSMQPFSRSVFVYERGDEQFEVPITTSLAAGNSGNCGFLVPVPDRLKAGRYRVYLRLYLKGGGRSDSYSFVTDLP